MPPPRPEGSASRWCAAAGRMSPALIERAEALNSERVVLVAPPRWERRSGPAAAAVAGAIAGESDPALPLGGAELKAWTALEARYGDSEIDPLVRAGVTPWRRRAVSVVRG